MSLNILWGNLKNDDEIFFENEKCGKVLIDGTYPFGLIKFKNNTFDFSNEYKCGKAVIKINKPDWIN